MMIKHNVSQTKIKTKEHPKWIENDFATTDATIYIYKGIILRNNLHHHQDRHHLRRHPNLTPPISCPFCELTFLSPTHFKGWQGL